jgi:orotate phosphoribosyltransferase
VLLVEDLTTDGGSKLSFVDAIRETGASVRAYGGDLLLRHLPRDRSRGWPRHGVKLHYLCTWWDVLAEARRDSGFDAATLDAVEAFLRAPRDWAR